LAIPITVWAGVSERSTSWPTARSRTARDELLGDLEVDIRLEQGAADLAHRLVDVGLGQAALAVEAGEGFVEAVGEGFEHGRLLGRGVLG
jgi:hypothetical protein